MFCEKCGTKLEDDAKTCQNCGAVIDDQPITPIVEEKPQIVYVKKPAKKNASTVAIIFIVLAVGLTLLFLGV
ncbi:MAG: zinc-ribbon domain-containing protein [Clostridia bacterium]|nr:zinc-ribbon domain-containing protein [Clostridia bacterium]